MRIAQASRGSLLRVAAEWARLASEMEFTSEWFDVRRDQVRRPDGSRGTYDHVVAPPAVTVLAMDDLRRVAVTRQWIYTHGAPQWRLPAGRVDADDGGPVAAARRELVEETGVAAVEWTALGAINCADSLTNHRDHAFFAEDLTTGPHHREPGEADLEVHWLPVDRVVEMVVAGELPHAGSTFAVLVARVRGLL